MNEGDNVELYTACFWRVKTEDLTIYKAKVIIVPHRIYMKLVHWPLMGGLLHLVQRRGDRSGHSPPRPLLAVPNVTAHLSTANVRITVLLDNDPLLCGFNVPKRDNVVHECSVLQVTKTEFVPKATTVVASCCVIVVAASLSDRLLTMRTLASTGYLDALVNVHYLPYYLSEKCQATCLI